MQKQSFGSVEVIWLDQAEVLGAVRKAVRRLARRRPEVKRVILFGSMARGDAVPGSDVDLLVVLAASDRPFLERLSFYRPSGVPVGVDVFPYTEKEITAMLAEGNAFVRQAISEGIVIFAKSEPKRKHDP